MNNNISTYLNKVDDDEISYFFQQFNFELHACGEWIVRDIKFLKNHINGDYEIIYIKEGKVELTIGDKIYICKKGDIVFIEPFKVYSVKCLVDNVSHYYLHFDINPVYLQEKFSNFILGNEGNVIKNNSLDLISIYKFIENEVNNRNLGYYEMVRTTLIQLFIYIIRMKEDKNYIEPPIEKTLLSRRVDIVNKVMDIINRNHGSFLKLVDISNELHISENYIYKSFVSVVKMSPNKYMQIYRIKKAEQLLKTRKLTLEEIASLLGYSSMFHLSTSFKKIFGISPKEYMKKLNM